MLRLRVVFFTPHAPSVPQNFKKLRMLPFEVNNSTFQNCTFFGFQPTVKGSAIKNVIELSLFLQLLFTNRILAILFLIPLRRNCRKKTFLNHCNMYTCVLKTPFNFYFLSNNQIYFDAKCFRKIFFLIILFKK